MISMKHRPFIALLLLMLLCTCQGCSLLDAPLTVSGDLPVFSAESAPLSNQHQHERDTWLGVYDGQLYYFPNCMYSTLETDYDRWLCAVGNGGLTKLCRPGGDGYVSLVGQQGRWLYYWDVHGAFDKPGDPYTLLCYDLAARQEVTICTGQNGYDDLTIFAPDGTIYIPLNVTRSDEIRQYLHVSGTQLLGVTTDVPAGYALGGATYAATRGHEPLASRIVATGADGAAQEVPMPYARIRCLLPAGDGLLVHNIDGGSLYRIAPDHSVTPLFAPPCMTSDTAIAIVGDDVYISLKRYEGWHESGKGLRRYENDTLEGTWRISITDFSAVKINDTIYNGLYCFGDILLACDESCSVYRLSPDGSAQPLIIVGD